MHEEIKVLEASLVPVAAATVMRVRVSFRTFPLKVAGWHRIKGVAG